MDEVRNKLELALSFVLETLEVYKAAKFVSVDSRETNLVVVTVKKANVKYTLVVSEIISNKRCLVSIFAESSNDEIESIVLDYGPDLKIVDDLEFPVNYDEYMKEIDTSKVCITVYKRFDKKRLMVRDSKKSQVTETVEKPLQHIKLPEEQLRERSKLLETEVTNTKRPNDMPKFDDEYEVNNGRPIDRYPGLNLPEKHPRQYGNPDLYPMGQKDPFNFNDINTRGGMTFDPFGTGNQSNMQGDNNEQRKRGPGWIPGSKYDDPFGKRTDEFNPGSGPGFSGSGMFM